MQYDNINNLIQFGKHKFDLNLKQLEHQFTTCINENSLDEQIIITKKDSKNK